LPWRDGGGLALAQLLDHGEHFLSGQEAFAFEQLHQGRGLPHVGAGDAPLNIRSRQTSDELLVLSLRERAERLRVHIPPGANGQCELGGGMGGAREAFEL